MKLYDEIQKSVRSLLMHRLRTILSTLGILFGIVAVIVMLAIGEGAKQEALEHIEQLGLHNLIIRQPLLSEEQCLQASEKCSKGLTEQDVKILGQNTPFILNQAAFKVIKASLTGTKTSFSPEILAVDHSYKEIKNLELVEGRFLCDLDQNRKQLVCVLGNEVAQNLGKEGHVGSILRIENVSYKIVGILKSTYWKASKNLAITHRNLNKVIFIPLGSEMILPQSAQNTLSEIILQFQNSEQLKLNTPLVSHILARLHGSYEDYQIIFPQELFQQAYRTQKTFNLVLGSIATLSLLIGGIGIMNIMLANVSERRREIGIRRAVGASQKHIILQFLRETLLLTFIGAILGIFVGIILAKIISEIAGWQVIVTYWSIIIALTMSFIVGICSGIYPAWQAALMDPIKALQNY